MEIFDIARVMGALFGTRDGRVMLRATQDLIGQKRLRVPDQGGTRKVVALAHTVDHLLRNMRAFHACGAQTKQHLIRVGCRLSNLKFVAFVIFVRDALRRRVAPIALKAQAVNMASWEMDRSCHEAGADIVSDKAKLLRLQTWCIVSSLLHSYVQKQDLRHLWLILSFSDLGNVFPKLVQNMYGLLHAQEFSFCALNVEHDPDTKDHNMLSPRCQCATMRSRPGMAPRRAVIELPRGRRLPNSVQGDRGILRISVPEWVAFSVYSPNEWQQPCSLPRFNRACRGHHHRLPFNGCPASDKLRVLFSVWSRQFYRLRRRQWWRHWQRQLCSSIDCHTIGLGTLQGVSVSTGQCEKQRVTPRYAGIGKH